MKKLPGGAFSEGVVDTLHVGDELDVMTPAGRFTTTLDPASAKTYVAIAAGSGITPVHLDRRRRSSRASRTPR